MGEELIGLNIQHFTPASGTNDFTVLKGAWTAGHLVPSVGLTFDYSWRPLSVMLPDETLVHVVSSQVQANLLFSMGLGTSLEIGGALPYSPMLTGDNLDELASLSGQTLAEVPGQSLGDTRLYVKATPIRSTKGLSLALLGQVTLPTGNSDALQSKGAPTVEPALVVEFRDSERLRAGLNLGYVWQTPQTFLSLTVGNELRYGLGLEYALVEDRLSLVTELWGRLAAGNGTGFSAQSSPAELALGVKMATGPARISLGAGPGVAQGYGTPAFRAYIGLGITPPAPSKAPVDSDRDGLTDELDKCKDEAEDIDSFMDGDGCPELDNDADGLPDAQDACAMEAEDKDGFKDDDGCPELDNDADELLDPTDRCPLEAENINGVQDDDGCPEADSDKDSIVDPLDKCPMSAETVNGVQDQDGCPEADADGDGIGDDVDKCPKKPELKNGIKDDDGCPEADTDGDGIIDPLDKCPKLAESMNGLEDADGCPEADKDGDLIPDAKDQCPKKPETKNGFEDEDGCPDQGKGGGAATPSKATGSGEGTVPAQATAPTQTAAPAQEKPIAAEAGSKGEPEGLPISGPLKPIKLLVFFGPDSLGFDERSLQVLNRTVDFLKASPAIKVSLQGFSEETGDPAKNMTQARTRAEAVQKYLIQNGIPAGRVEVKAMGSKFPRGSNDTAEGRASNRRVRILPMDAKGTAMEKLPAGLDVPIPKDL